jgi:hypothetical protein
MHPAEAGGGDMSAQLDLLRPPPDPAESEDARVAPCAGRGSANRVDRRQKARDIQEAGARRWILAGKPIAIEVARIRGKVTAETFRAAAEKLDALPPTYGEQRALSWIPSMFYSLCQEGSLRKRRRVDGSVVKEYSEEQGNDQVVYELEGAR